MPWCPSQARHTPRYEDDRARRRGQTLYLSVTPKGDLYLKLQGGEGWLLSIVITAVAWGAFYGLFDRLLHLPFPAGWVLTWFD